MLRHPFIRAEEERLVLDDGSPNGASILVALKWRDGFCLAVEIVLGIETCIAKEAKGSPVEVVGPRLHDGVDYRAGVSSVLGGVVGGEHGKFLNGVCAEVGPDDASRRSIRIIVDVDSVHAIAVFIRAVAGVRQLVSEAAIGTVRGGRTRARLRAHRVDSRLKSSQLGPVAAVQGQFAYGGGIHLRAQRRGS